PFLCLYLGYRRWGGKLEDRRCGGDRGGVRDLTTSRAPCSTTSSFSSRVSHLPTSISYVVLAVLALLYAPTRLVQEANPEWRLVSWALALEVIGLTLVWLYWTTGQQDYRTTGLLDHGNGKASP